MKTKEEIAKEIALVILPHDSLDTRTKLVTRAINAWEDELRGTLARAARAATAKRSNPKAISEVWTDERGMTGS